MSQATENIAAQYAAAQKVKKVWGNIFVNAKDLGIEGDGETDDTAKIQAAFSALKNSTTLYFPQGTYKTNISGFLISVASKSNVKIIGKEAVFIIADQGMQFSFCNGLHFSGITFQRATQAVWGANKAGLYVSDSKNVTIERNEISKFTDALSVTNCTTMRIYKNVFHDLGEEPIAVRRSKNVVVEENEAYDYLGDGVLNKGTTDLSVVRNYLHCENTKTSNLALWTVLSGGNSAAPAQGGGVTCNAEDGVYFNLNMTIDDNRIYNTIYGIAAAGITGCKIVNNRIKDVGLSSGIAFSGSSQFNPNLIPNYDVVIAFNQVDNLLNPGAQYGLYFRLFQVPADRAVIYGNTIRPNGPHKGISIEGNCHAFGNTVDKCEVMFELYGGATATNNTILDTFVPEFGRALSLYDYAVATNNIIRSSAPVQVWGKGARFCNNTIRSTATVNTWAVYVIAGASNNTIMDNLISSACNKEIAGDDADWRTKNKYGGVLERAGVQYWNPAPMPQYATRPSVLEFGRVTGSQIFDTTLGLPVVWNATHWIEGNYGRVTASGDGVATTYQIPHGLSAAPNYCNVLPSSSGASTAGVRYVDADATNITVHFANVMPSGTNNITLYWEAKVK